MSNFGMAVELKGIAIGREQEKEQLSLEHIRNVMESTKWSAQQVMDAMKIPKSEQAHYTSILDSDEHNQEDWKISCNNGEERINRCEAIERIRNDAREEGLKEGF